MERAHAESAARGRRAKTLVLSPAATLVGREDVLGAVVRALAEPRGKGIVLYGPRRIGKTAILQHLAAALPELSGHLPVYFDLDGKGARPLDHVLAELAGVIAAPLALPEPAPGPDVERWFRDAWLPGVLNTLPDGASLVLLLDELDAPDGSEPRPAAAALHAYVRRLLDQHAPRLRAVIALGRSLDDLADLAQPLYRALPSCRVSLLPREDAAALARLAEGPAGPRWSDEAVEAAWALTRGHPPLLSALAAQVRPAGRTAGPADVQAAVEPTLSRSRSAFEWIWKALPPGARVAAAALAQAGPDAVAEEQLHAVIRAHDLRAIPPALRDAPRRLVEWDLVESPAPGKYRFRVELLRRLVARYKPLTFVQQELDLIDPVADEPTRDAPTHVIYDAKPLPAAPAPKPVTAPRRAPEPPPMPEPPAARPPELGPAIARELDAEKRARAAAEAKAATLVAERDRLLAEARARAVDAPQVVVGPDPIELGRRLEAERRARSAAEAELTMLGSDRERLLIEARSGAAERERMASSIQTLSLERDQLSVELEDARAEHEKLRAEIQGLRADQDKARAQREVARVEADKERKKRRRALVPPAILLAGAAAIAAAYALQAKRVEILSGPITLLDRAETQKVAAAKILRIGVRRPARDVAWSSADPAVATVDGAGTITPAGTGRTQIIARVGGASASVDVSVSLPARVMVEPATITLAPDAADVVLKAAILDGAGHPWAKGGEIAWASSDAAVATLAGGKLHRAGPGKATVEARFGTLTGRAAVVSLDRRGWLEKACADGGPAACVDLGRALEKGEEGPADLARALSLFEKACDGGALAGCAELGAYHESGKGGTPDLGKALAAYTKACDGHEQLGCSRLGSMYESGWGAVRDVAKAHQLYGAACDAGELTACWHLGGLYEIGTGVARDAPVAVGHYKKACDGGLMPACASLANMYWNGSGTVPKDLPAGLALYEKACDAKHEPSCTFLALKYKAGEGVEENRTKSQAFFFKACTAGNKSACVIAPRAPEP